MLTKPYKITPFCTQQNEPEINKNSTSHMFDANNISTRSCMFHIRLKCLQAVFYKITLTASRHQIHSKTKIHTQ